MNFIDYKVKQELIDFFRKQAEQKIEVEGWGRQGRNVEIKKENFVHCWTTEEAFKQLLIEKKKWFRHRGLYFGDAVGAGADFTVRIEGKEVTMGLRSVASDSLERWKSVAYPDDRFQYEKDKIADYHLLCNHSDGLTTFYGLISKEELLKELEHSERKYSKNNQEYFRTIPLSKFSLENLQNLLEKIDKV